VVIVHGGKLQTGGKYDTSRSSHIYFQHRFSRAPIPRRIDLCKPLYCHTPQPDYSHNSPPQTYSRLFQSHSLAFLIKTIRNILPNFAKTASFSKMIMGIVSKPRLACISCSAHQARFLRRSSEKCDCLLSIFRCL
jgi:hypothetical protein